MITFPRLLKQQQTVIIVTGLSGAGKTSVMSTLADLDYYCVDNLPLPLLPTFLNLASTSSNKLLNVALGIDARGEHFLQNFTEQINIIKNNEKTKNIKILFLEAREETLLKRFQETRRKHPLSQGISLLQAIKREKNLLKPIMQMADIVVETDTFNIHHLRKWVRTSLFDDQQRKIVVQLLSFGFKYGLPTESNLVYDVRFLPNPYFIPALKALTGKDTTIQDFLFKQPEVVDYWNKLNSFLEFSLKKFHEEGRSFVTVAIGCTGGKHRSVSFVERLTQNKWNNIQFLPHHRDLGKE